MKKRWFVVILTIGLLLRVLPLSVLALSPDPITDPDGSLMGWSDLSTVSDSLDDLQEQRLAVVDAKSGTAAAPGLSEADSENPPPLRMRTAIKQQRMTRLRQIPLPSLLTRKRVAMTLRTTRAAPHPRRKALRTRTAMKQQRMTGPQ